MNPLHSSATTRRLSGFTAAFRLLMILGILTSSCQKMEDDGAEVPLELGVLLPVTGTASSAGESVQAGLTMAIEEVNDYFGATGAPWRATLTIRNTDTDPQTALQQLEELYSQGFRYVIGPYTSANAAALLDHANQKGMILLSPSSVASSLAIAGDNLYRLVPTDGKQAEAISALFSHDSIAAIIPIVRDDVWGDGLIEDVSLVSDEQGTTVLSPIRYDPSDVNSVAIAAAAALSINQALQQFPASRIGVYLVSFGEGTSVLEAAAREPGCALVNWYGSSAFANNADLLHNPVAADFARQRSLRCPSFAPDPAASDLWEPVSDQLTAELGRSPEIYALTAYDAVWLMALAYSGLPDHSNSENFKSVLEEVAKYHYGITGRLTFDAAGDRKHSSFNFWGLWHSDNSYHWKSYGQFSNANGLQMTE
jgi:branched-chain amino acid transport system substrate-binding protein